MRVVQHSRQKVSGRLRAAIRRLATTGSPARELWLEVLLRGVSDLWDRSYGDCSWPFRECEFVRSGSFDTLCFLVDLDPGAVLNMVDAAYAASPPKQKAQMGGEAGLTPAGRRLEEMADRVAAARAQSMVGLVQEMKERVDAVESRIDEMIRWRAAVG